MESTEGVTPAEGCPHFITEERVTSWRKLHGDALTKCGGCNRDGFVPSHKLRATRRRTYDASRVSPLRKAS